MSLGILFLTTQIFMAPVQVKVILDHKPVSNQIVEFALSTNGAEPVLKTKSTNSAGLATFEIDPKQNQEFIFRTAFEQVLYFSSVYNSKNTLKGPISLPIYRTTPSVDAAVLNEVRLFYRLEEGALRIDEDLILENPTQTTIMGKPDPQHPEQAPETFRIKLPSSNFDLKFGDGFSEQTTQIVGNDIIVTRPLLPGMTRMSFTYAVELTALKYLFKHEFSAPIQTLHIGFNDPSLKATGYDFQAGPTKTFEEKSMTPLSYEFKTPNTLIAFTIEGLGFNIRWLYFLPFLILAGLIAASFMTSSRRSELDIDQDRRAQLEEWLLAKRMREQNLIGEDDFLRRKLKVLERLAPLYNNRET